MIVMLFPFYWMLITSLKPNQELYNARIMPLVVYHPTLEHYVGLSTKTNFFGWTFDTLLVATVTTMVSLDFGAMAAYPLARTNFPGAGLIRLAIAANSLA